MDNIRKASIVLVLGGMGFIGSHIVVELLQGPFIPVIIDNLSNSKEDVLDKIELITKQRPYFFNCDLCNFESFHNIIESILDSPDLKNFKIESVIHLAGLKAVNESIKVPILYYQNNLVSSLNVLRIMEEYGIYNLIFSSSATVYGTLTSTSEISKEISSANSTKISTERFFPEGFFKKGSSTSTYESPSTNIGISEKVTIGTGITNPYGMTKYMIELMLKDLKLSDKENKWNIISLRYFNPVGAHPSGLIGENPLGIPNNLMPVILNAVRNNTILNVFGNDYDTSDGTCVRDFIHVVDLAKAHIAALNSFCINGGANKGAHEDAAEGAKVNTDDKEGVKVGKYRVYNLGTGKGTSVLELINCFERTNNLKVGYKITDRREGDLPSTFCNPELARKELGWKAEKSLEDICSDAFRFASL